MKHKSKSIKYLINYLYNVLPNITSVVASKIKVKPIKEVLEFCKNDPRVEWEIVGHTFDEKRNKIIPIYSKDIKIINGEK